MLGNVNALCRRFPAVLAVFGDAEIAVEIACHRVCAFGFITIPFCPCSHIQMHRSISTGDIGNAAEAQILSLAAHRLCGNDTAGLVIAHHVRRRAFGMLSCSIAANCLVMCCTAVAAADDDLAAVQRRIQPFQHGNQLLRHLKRVRRTAFAAEFSGTKMCRKPWVFLIRICCHFISS